MTDDERTLFQNSMPDIKQKILQTTEERINKYYKIMSYHKYMKSNINLKNTLLIIDEI